MGLGSGSGLINPFTAHVMLKISPLLFEFCFQYTALINASYLSQIEKSLLFDVALNQRSHLLRQHSTQRGAWAQ